MNYSEFIMFMYNDCGMPMTEDGAVHCCECDEPSCECDEPIYEEDFQDHNWETYPACEFNITE